MRCLIAGLVGSTFAFCCLEQVNAQLVPNGGFETADLTGWEPIDCETPGSSYGVAQFDVDGDGSDSWAFWTLPEVQGDTLKLEQDLALVGGQLYDLRVDIAASNTSAGWNGGVRTVAAWIGDSIVASFSFFDVMGDMPPNSIFRHALEGQFTPPSSGSYPFKLTFQRPWIEFDPIRGWADNVSLVPEPSTLILLATGALGLLAYGWRRRPR